MKKFDASQVETNQDTWSYQTPELVELGLVTDLTQYTVSVTAN